MIYVRVSQEESLLRPLRIMSDKNLEDNDIEPTPKLIGVVFQNCQGQVEHWVKPYIRLMVERLRVVETRETLKCLLVQVVTCKKLGGETEIEPL
ncbi:hypothetical protein HanXRQr2_Chr09g0365351 [Helianthus annuus]|uniref:Uncharacterized protein n=1 Tax=Helianthus annuus TaxID=4232 RepID=A0A251TR52_HELAN|nr:hypothetical protein HanXRQr2_Chr09g0365351 [Helianthus annuus]